MKASAFEGSVFTHSDAKPGMVVKGKVTSVGDFGAYVQLSTGLKELCPLTHMSELEVPNPGKKFKVGADVAFRVLGFKSRLISVTHNKTLRIIGDEVEKVKGFPVDTILPVGERVKILGRVANVDDLQLNAAERKLMHAYNEKPVSVLINMIENKLCFCFDQYH
ncbi:hypothetical protein MKX01_004347 [Papaver californicum]|nr:hypothetical protein MKX01_004347 [Papaver californicum]